MRYIFEDGGSTLQPQFDYTDAGFFNSLVDNALQQQQQSQQQYTQPAQTQEEQQPEESDFIKNLRSYDSEQQNKQLQENFDLLEKHLTMQINNLQEQLDGQQWLSSDDGFNFMSNLYDSQKDGNPAFAPTTTTNALPKQLEERQLNAESGGNPNAVSPKGALGAYQFMPATWQEYKPSANASPFNPTDAKYAYNKYMNVLLNQFGQDPRKAVAAYNAGPTRVQKLINQYGNDWEQHLPTETKQYLTNIFNNQQPQEYDNIPVKPGANIQNVNSGLLSLVSGFTQTFPGLVVTSGTDGKHMANSAHYDGDAVDIGANSSTKQAYNAFKQSLPELQRKYGIKYLDEGDHIHISLSSKGKT